MLIATSGGDGVALQQRVRQIAPQIDAVEVCTRLDLLRELVRYQDYHALLLDLASGAAGLAVVADAVRACPLTPVIVVSNLPESALGDQVLRVGAQDYLVKRETNGAQLVRAVLHAVERKRLETRLKTTLGELGQANARLRSLALRDTLTGALNRRAFHVIGGQMLDRARRHRRRLALLYCDLDGFKLINDRLGHRVGDAVLKVFRMRCAGVLRRGDSLARLGGDEFAVLLENADVERAVEAAGRIRAALRDPIDAEGERVNLGVSIGIAGFPECPDLEAMIAAADAAMYLAKAGAGVACQQRDRIEDLARE